MRFLYKARISITGNTYTFNCAPLNDVKGSNKTFVFKGPEEKALLFLRRVKAKDTATTPYSLKGRTYQQMLDTAKNGSDPYVYIWSNMLPDSLITSYEEKSFLSSSHNALGYIEEKINNLQEG